MSDVAYRISVFYSSVPSVVTQAEIYRDRRVRNMEATMLRLDGFNQSEVATLTGVTHQTAKDRSLRGAPYVLRILRSLT